MRRNVGCDATMFPMKKAVIYARISDDRENTRAGVDRQVEDCTQLIERNGWELAGTYVDNDRGAYSGKRRPEWERLTAAVEAGSVDVIVAYGADRLTRHVRELEDLVDLVESTGTRIATVTSGDYDLETADGRAVARIHGVIARQSSEKAAERIRRAQRQAAVEGRPHGGRRRFGYGKDGITIVEEEAELIRTGAAALLTGVPLAQVARDWNTAGVSTPRGAVWMPQTVRDVLDNPRLIGKRTYQGRVVGDAVWESILDDATFRALQAMFNDPERKQIGSPGRSLFAGMIRCECGAAMFQSRRSADGVALYHCDRRTGCGNVSAVVKHVDRVVSEAFLDVIAEPDNVGLLTADDGGRRASVIVADLDQLDEKERDLGARLAAGKITGLMLEGALAHIGAERAVLEAELRDVAGGAPRLTVAQLTGLADVWDGLDRDDRRAALEVLISRVTVSKATRATGNRFDESRVSITWVEA